MFNVSAAISVIVGLYIMLVGFGLKIGPEKLRGRKGAILLGVMICLGGAATSISSDRAKAAQAAESLAAIMKTEAGQLPKVVDAETQLVGIDAEHSSLVISYKVDAPSEDDLTAKVDTMRQAQLAAACSRRSYEEPWSKGVTIRFAFTSDGLDAQELRMDPAFCERSIG